MSEYLIIYLFIYLLSIYLSIYLLLFQSISLLLFLGIHSFEFVLISIFQSVTFHECLEVGDNISNDDILIRKRRDMLNTVSDGYIRVSVKES